MRKRTIIMKVQCTNGGGMAMSVMGDVSNSVNTLTVQKQQRHWHDRASSSYDATSRSSSRSLSGAVNASAGSARRRCSQQPIHSISTDRR